MNDANANNPDGNVIFSGTKEVAENLNLMEMLFSQGPKRWQKI